MAFAKRLARRLVPRFLDQVSGNHGVFQIRQPVLLVERTRLEQTRRSLVPYRSVSGDADEPGWDLYLLHLRLGHRHGTSSSARSVTGLLPFRIAAVCCGVSAVSSMGALAAVMCRSPSRLGG